MAEIIDIRTRKIVWRDTVVRIADFVRANPPKVTK